MVQTMRSADVLSAMDPSKLYVKLSSSEVGVLGDGMVPTAFPVSPSHSSSSSTDPPSTSSGASSEDEESEQDKEPFMAMLIADPLYIHGQILLELAAKEQRAQSMTVATNQTNHEEGRNPNSAENTNDHGGPYDLENFYTFDGFHSDSVLPHHGEEQISTTTTPANMQAPVAPNTSCSPATDDAAVMRATTATFVHPAPPVLQPEAPPRGSPSKAPKTKEQRLRSNSKPAKKTAGARRPRCSTTIVANANNYNNKAAVQSKKKQKTKAAASMVSAGVADTTIASTITGYCSSDSSAPPTAPPVKLLSVLHTSSRSQQPMVVRTTPVAAVKPNTVLQQLLKKHGMPSLRIRANNNNKQQQSPAASTFSNTSISALRLASFGSKLLTAVDAADLTTLRRMFALGVSPNPCNKFADDVLFTTCKRSSSTSSDAGGTTAANAAATVTIDRNFNANNNAVFDCFIQHGANVRVVDQTGRTCLHYCAWAESFNEHIVSTLLRHDPYQLFREDYRGQTPLDHVHDGVAAEWNEFLRQHFDRLYGAGRLPALIQSLKVQREQEATAATTAASSWTDRQLDDIRELVGASRLGRTKSM